MYRIIVLLLFVMLLITPAAAQVSVQAQIVLPPLIGPPPVAVVPEVRPVRVVAIPDANLFVYQEQFWLYQQGGWYVSRMYGGPWVGVEPRFVPRPLLRVPTKYYRAPPGQWKEKKWDRRYPPRWGEQYGEDWSKHRTWKDQPREKPGKPEKPPKPKKQKPDKN